MARRRGNRTLNHIKSHIMKYVAELPEMEQIVVENITEKDNTILRTILGDEWKKLLWWSERTPF